MTRLLTSGGFYRYILEDDDQTHNIVFHLKATPERKEKKYPELDQLEAELVAAR